MCTMNYNREGFVKKHLFFLVHHVPFSDRIQCGCQAETFLVSLLGEHIQWVWEADVLIQGGVHSRILCFSFLMLLRLLQKNSSQRPEFFVSLLSYRIYAHFLRSRPKRSNLTVPSILAKRVSSPPRPTFSPG